MQPLLGNVSVLCLTSAHQKQSLVQKTQLDEATIQGLRGSAIHPIIKDTALNMLTAFHFLHATV